MSKSSEPPQIYESEIQDDWLDRFARFNQHFGRFIRDALGVLLIAAALMILFALRGYTEGVLLTPWADRLSLWFGWGAYLVVIAIGYAGYVFLRRGVAGCFRRQFTRSGPVRSRGWPDWLGYHQVGLAIHRRNLGHALVVCPMVSHSDERIQCMGTDRAVFDETCR